MLVRQSTRCSARSTGRWQASPVAAGAVRLTAFAAPVVMSFLVIRAVGGYLFRPPGWGGLAVWVVQAAVIGIGISLATDRYTRRLLPLASLLSLSLVFPDRAPSRFGVALRSGSVRQMTNRLTDAGELGGSEDEAAKTALAMVTALGQHDRRTRGHTDRVRAYADLIADELDLPADARDKLAWGVLLHDLGKLLVPAEILNKAEPLTDSEWAVLKRHPAVGGRMLGPLDSWLGEWGLAARDHHERWDGLGYPSGLAGEEISLAGRITSVADAYDVITSKRSYKEPSSSEAARSELVSCAGTQFDPVVVRAMLNASLGRRWSFGPLAWLSELPIGQATATLSATPLVVAASTVASVAAVGGALELQGQSAELAFAAELSPADAELPLVDDADVAPATETTPDAEPGTTGVEPTSIPSSSAPTTTVPATAVPSTAVPSTGIPSAGPSTTIPGTPSTGETTSPPTTGSTSSAPGQSPGSEAPTTTAPPAATTTTQEEAAASPPPPPAAPPTDGASAPPPASMWYLKNDGVGDTDTQIFKDLASDGPDNAVQPNYDLDTDARPGLRLVGTGAGFGEGRPSHHQRFGLSAGSLTLTGSPALTIYAAVDPDGGTAPATLRAAISECSGLYLFCTNIATATAVVSTPSDDGFEKLNFGFGPVDHTFGARGVLVVRMITDEGRVVQTAFDSEPYPSALIANLD